MVTWGSCHTPQCPSRPFGFGCSGWPIPVAVGRGTFALCVGRRHPDSVLFALRENASGTGVRVSRAERDSVAVDGVDDGIKERCDLAKVVFFSVQLDVESLRNRDIDT